MLKKKIFLTFSRKFNAIDNDDDEDGKNENGAQKQEREEGVNREGEIVFPFVIR